MINQSKQCWQLKRSSFPTEKAASALQMFPYVKQHIQEVIYPVVFFSHVLLREISLLFWKKKEN